MKLIEQLITEAGGDTAKAFYVVPDFGGYFSGVKQVAEYTKDKIVLAQRKRTLTVSGENLEIGRYFEQDVFIKGVILHVEID